MVKINLNSYFELLSFSVTFFIVSGSGVLGGTAPVFESVGNG